MKHRNPQANVLRDILEIFDGLGLKHVDSHKEDVPDTLFHYTNVCGLEGILQNRTFWATEYRYLNDKEELLYGEKLICQHMKDFLKSANPETQNALAPIFREVVGEAYGSPSIIRSWNNYIFTISFSELGNDLNQWRSYGDDAHGYSIGIDTTKVRGKNLRKNRLEFLKLVYDSAKQAALINSAIVDAVDVINYALKTYDNIPLEQLNRLLSLGLSSMMFNLCLLFKHHAFQAEQEWRVIIVQKANDEEEKLIADDKNLPSKIKFRTSGDTMIPYVKVDFSVENEDCLIPINSIFLGPRHRNYWDKRSLRSLNMFLQSLKYSNDISKRLHISDIPYQ